MLELRSPIAVSDSKHWEKWRNTYAGGDEFVNLYLNKLSSRESVTDFAERKTMSFCPNFAGAAVDDIKNNIYQRISEVQRSGGPTSYQSAINGELGGVDLNMSDMSTFMGLKVLPELLITAKVGVLVDNFEYLGTTQYEKGTSHPYLGLYAVEDIWNWTVKNGILEQVLLRDTVPQYDDTYGLYVGTTSTYRLYRRRDDGIHVVFMDEQKNQLHETVLDLEHIPFVIFETSRSLLKDVCGYQIALTNIESSDVSFIMKANFPFYYEFFDARTEGSGIPNSHDDLDDATAGSAATVEGSKSKTITVGPTQGRAYQMGMDPPGFINPDPDTVRVSMEKAEQLKKDIRLLVNLNLITMNPRRSSAESKQMDQTSLEASLSYIGTLLEKGENEILKHWSAFEGHKESGKVAYPRSYKLVSDEERREEADKLLRILPSVPSETFRKAIIMKVAKTLVGPLVTREQLGDILKEIEASNTLISDTSTLIEMFREGMLDGETVDKAIGLPDGTYTKAQDQRIKRIEATLEAQGGVENASQARGGDDFGGTRSEQEKEGKKVRGEGKFAEGDSE